MQGPWRIPKRGRAPVRKGLRAVGGGGAGPAGIAPFPAPDQLAGRGPTVPSSFSQSGAPAALRTG